jgi:GLPGLI family protein
VQALFIIIENIHAQKESLGILKYSQITAFEDTTKKNLIPVDLIFSQYESVTVAGVLQKMSKRDTSRIMPSQSDLKKRYAVYVNLKTNRMMSRQRADRELVIVDDVLDKIDWKIKTQIRKIGNITCHRAEAMVRGRYYIAWFAPEIPIGVGPWKLHGLPGLILNAKSIDNEVEFRFEALKLPISNEYQIKPLESLPNMKVLKEKEFLKLHKMNEDNFVKMMQSQPDYEKGTVTFKTKWIEIYAQKP